jgi:hypothetical protein
MRVRLTTKLQFFSTGILLLAWCTPLMAGETGKAKSYLSAGIGLEQLHYKEQLSEISLVNSDPAVTNWVLYLEGQKAIQDLYIGFKGYIPIVSGDTQETWSRAGNFEQSNSLTYQWTRVDAYLGYALHHLFSPYLGMNWSYTKQERSDFVTTDQPDIINATATEEVQSFSALLGLRGDIDIAAQWSFVYFFEYLLPFYSSTENTELPGWEASNIDGYSYSITGRLNYFVAEQTALSLQFTGGKRHWDGSDWVPVNNSRAKWPENDTKFIGGFISILKTF